MKPSKSQLEHWYADERKSTRAIAEMCGVSHTTVKRWLRVEGVERRPQGRGLANRGIQPPGREELYRLIHFEHRSYREVAEQFGVDFTAIPYWLKMHDIPLPSIWETRRKGVSPTLPTEQELRTLYEQGVSLAAIGRKFGVSRQPIVRLCHEIGIDLRPDGWQGKRFPCVDGHVVRSTYEQRVDDWLSEHGVTHEYEPPLPFDGRYHADFLANGWYIEIWGVNAKDYRARKRRKLQRYREHHLPLIHFTWEAFSARRYSWERRLIPCLHCPPPFSPPDVTVRQQTLSGLFPLPE